MKTINFCAVLAPLGVSVCETTAQAAQAQVIDARTKDLSRSRLPPGVAPGGPMERMLSVEGRAEAQPEFIEFTTVKTEIDAGSLGEPAYIGTWRSEDVAQVELRSSVGVGVRYESGVNLTSERNGQALETQWETSIQGVWRVPGGAFKRTSYGEFMPTSVGSGAQQGDAIEFAHPFDRSNPSDPLAVKGFQTRVAVTRSGLQDHGGSYKGSLSLSWYRF